MVQVQMIQFTVFKWTVWFTRTMWVGTVLVMVNINIEVPVDLKLQLRRCTSTLIFTYIYLIYLIILFLCIELKKMLVSEFFFKFKKYFFCTSTPTTKKLDDSIPVCTTFLGLQIPVFIV